mmetsp:Transcript_30787/g.75176  ORF Transcript_30787/g.75176 Transcript_30787/m.75176 type:complete len:266 (-) Transcript_30787:197-994(-)
MRNSIKSRETPCALAAADTISSIRGRMRSKRAANPGCATTLSVSRRPGSSQKLTRTQSRHTDVPRNAITTSSRLRASPSPPADCGESTRVLTTATTSLASTIFDVEKPRSDMQRIVSSKSPYTACATSALPFASLEVYANACCSTSCHCTCVNSFSTAKSPSTSLVAMRAAGSNADTLPSNANDCRSRSSMMSRRDSRRRALPATRMAIENARVASDRVASRCAKHDSHAMHSVSHALPTLLSTICLANTFAPSMYCFTAASTAS